MALAFPELPKLPETNEEITAFWKKIDENDAVEVNLELYFSKEELAQMCDLEKRRVCNIKRNYDMMKEMGLPVQKPLFMQKNKKKPQEDLASSSESDVEWTPALERPKKKSTGPVKSIWVAPSKKPPKKKKDAIPEEFIQEEGENEAECDFEGFDLDERVECVKELKKYKSVRGRLKREIKKGFINVEANLLDFPADLKDFDEEAAMLSLKGKKPKKKQPVFKPPMIPLKRYPRRNIPITNYADIEVPDDDHFLFCDDCHEEYLGDCPTHGPLKIVEDSKAEKGTEDYAENTAPHNLVVKTSQIPHAGLGVWTNQPMEKGVRLGPYVGEYVKTEDKAHVSGYSWQVHGQKEKQSHFIDAGDSTKSNWMRYVNCARNEEEQNLLAFQYKGEIYYRTIKDVPADCELFVWYGDEYGKELGIQLGSPQHVQRLMNLLQQQSKRKQEDRTAFWQLHCRKIEVPQSEWKTPVPHNKGFPCDVCGVAFVKEEYMLKHRKNAHMEMYRTEKKHRCDQCSYSCDKKGSLARHMSVHTGQRPYACDQCGKGFTRASSIKRHGLIHSEEKSYQCTVCDKRFTRSHHLSRHMKIHNNVYDFQCTFCDKSFNQHYNLKSHLKIHTAVQDYACTHCDYKTNRGGTLKQHVIARHTHDYPHHCSVCGKGFVVPREMNKHIANHHESFV